MPPSLKQGARHDGDKFYHTYNQAMTARKSITQKTLTDAITETIISKTSLTNQQANMIARTLQDRFIIRRRPTDKTETKS